MRTNRLRAAAGAATVLLALTACNSDTSPAADTAPESEAPTSQSPSETPSAEPSEETPDAASGGYDADELVAAMSAAVLDKRSAHLTMTMEQGGQSMKAEGDVSYAGDTTAMQLAMSAPQLGGDLELRLVGRTVYLSVPPLTPKGKFLKIDTDDPNSPFADLGGFTESDPLATFEDFDAGLEEVTYLGEEDVDGETLHHYVLTVDTKKAAKVQGQPVPEGPAKVTYDLWIDDADLMRRIEFSEGGGGMTMQLDKWGEPVTVKAPPASAIVKTPTLPGAPS